MSTREPAPHVVVGIDDSPQAHEAVRWAVNHARLTGAHVRAVAAWVAPTTAMPGPGIGAAGMAVNTPDDEQLEILAGRWLDDALTPLPDADAVVFRRVVHGDAATVLLDEAEGAQLLVLGNSARGALANAVVGSVASRCVHHAGCPVVLVPTPPSDGPDR